VPLFEICLVACGVETTATWLIFLSLPAAEHRQLLLQYGLRVLRLGARDREDVVRLAPAELPDRDRRDGRDQPDRQNEPSAPEREARDAVQIRRHVSIPPVIGNRLGCSPSYDTYLPPVK
jgi:hypothetical protein